MPRPMKKASKRGTRRVLLEGELTIRNIGEIRGLLAGALDGASPLLIDASRVTIADTAGIQLLIAFLQAAEMRGLTAGWAGISPPMRDTACLLGLSRWLPVDGAVAMSR